MHWFFFFCYCCSVSFFPQNKIPEKLKRRGELSYKIWVKPVENMITWALPDELQPFSTKMASSFTYEKDLSWTFRNYDKMNGLLGLMSPSHLTRSKSKARYNRNTTNIKKKKSHCFKKNAVWTSRVKNWVLIKSKRIINHGYEGIKEKPEHSL